MRKLTFFLFGTVLSLGLSAQVYVSTSPMNKNAIIEEFTGVQCPNCPDGHTVLAAILAGNPGRAFGIGYHPTNSSYTEPFAGNPDFRRVYLDAFYSTPYCGTSRFMPSAFVNRRAWQAGERIQSRTNWASEATTIMSESSPMNVGLGTSYETGTHMLTINVEVYFTATVSDDINIYVMIAENDLIAEQSSGSATYVHKHVFRESLVSQWGDPISGGTSTGDLFTHEYTFDNSDSLYDMDHCEVSVFVYDETIGEVITGNQVAVGESTSGMVEGPAGLTAGLYPNPFEDQVQLVVNLPEASDVNYSLVNINGTLISQGNWGARNAGLQSLPLELPAGLNAGLYFLRITTGNETTVVKMCKN